MASPPRRHPPFDLPALTRESRSVSISAFSIALPGDGSPDVPAPGRHPRGPHQHCGIPHDSPKSTTSTGFRGCSVQGCRAVEACAAGVRPGTGGWMSARERARVPHHGNPGRRRFACRPVLGAQQSPHDATRIHRRSRTPSVLRSMPDALSTGSRMPTPLDPLDGLSETISVSSAPPALGGRQPGTNVLTNQIGTHPDDYI